jgi:predicted GH43/DUF377 family glycosyl hydrolase
MFTVRRAEHNPLLSPRRGHPWESIAAFNPSAVQTEDGTRIFYRALGNPDALQTPAASLSSIGTAFAEDGIHFHSREQVIAPSEPWDAFGCEDPRVTFFEGTWYCFYTALGGYPFGPDNIKVAVALGDSPTHFTERHLVTPFNAKAATLFPERVHGDVVLLLTAHTDWTADYPRPTIAIARAKEVSDFFSASYWQTWHRDLENHAIQELRRTDVDHIEVGAAPLLTEQGWLLIYSYIDEYYHEDKRIFSVEAALLDADDPRKRISRTFPFLVPEEIYEQYGIVPRIVFPSGATLENETTLAIWYGGADTVCAKATLHLPDLLRTLDKTQAARPFVRAANNPVLLPQGDGFEARDVFNPAALDIDGTVYILYRAMSADNTSTIGLALSKDGVHIDERLPKPLYVPRADFEQKKGKIDGNSGCEDARIVRIGDMLYMTYTAYDGVSAPRGALTALSVRDFLARNFDAWQMPKLVTPDGVDDKDLALLPKKIDGNYVLYHRVHNQVCADLIPNLSFDERISRCIEILQPRHGMWDSAKVGMTAPPIAVGENWLALYHGVSSHGVYRVGAALLAPDGITVLARTADPIFEPEAPYEIEGEVANVVFPCGAIVRGDTLFLYYGGADRVVGVATGALSRIAESLSW